MKRVYFTKRKRVSIRAMVNTVAGAIPIEAREVFLGFLEHRHLENVEDLQQTLAALADTAQAVAGADGQRQFREIDAGYAELCRELQVTDDGTVTSFPPFGTGWNSLPDWPEATSQIAYSD